MERTPERTRPAQAPKPGPRRLQAPISEIQVPLARYPNLAHTFWHTPIVDSREPALRVVYSAAKRTWEAQERKMQEFEFLVSRGDDILLREIEQVPGLDPARGTVTEVAEKADEPGASIRVHSEMVRSPS